MIAAVSQVVVEIGCRDPVWLRITEAVVFGILAICGLIVIGLMVHEWRDLQ